MARISGVNIPNDKRAEISLTYIFGIGLTTSQKILKDVKLDPNTKVKDFSDEEINLLRKRIETIKVEGELRREKIGNIKRLKEVKSYRGNRHVKGLPARGQRSPYPRSKTFLHSLRALGVTTRLPKNGAIFVTPPESVIIPRHTVRA